MGYIYLTRNKINDKIYVGKTARKSAESSDYFGSGMAISNAIKKYGRENFTKIILEDDINDNNLLSQLEIYWIALFDATNFNIGYNITIGGEGVTGLVFTPESRAKMSEAKKGKTNAKGHVVSPETRAILSKASKGRVHTPEEITKMSEAHKGRTHTIEARIRMSEAQKGRVFTPEHKAKIGKAHKGKRLSERVKRTISNTLKGRRDIK